METSQTLDANPFDPSSALNRFSTYREFIEALVEEPTGPALLYQVPGKPGTKAFALSGDNDVVGRLSKQKGGSNGCDLAIDDGELSKRHFQIKYQNGELTLEDLGSKNGTYVNSEATRLDCSRTLVVADQIHAGGLLFVFVDTFQPLS